MSWKLAVTVLGLSLFVMSVGLFESDANAGCATIGGKYTCAKWITGSNIDTITVNGVGKVCDASGCSEFLAAVGGTIPTSQSPSGACTEAGAFPNDSDHCGVQGVAFCVNPASNSPHAQGQPFTLDAVLEGTSGLVLCQKNGKCTGTIPLDATTEQVQCINPQWTLLTFTATKYKGKSAYCTTQWDSSDPPVCMNGGEVRTLVELCSIDPSLVKSTGGQSVPCTPLP